MRGRDDIARRLGGEFFLATGAAEEIAAAGMLGVVPGSRRVDRHATHRIVCLCRRLGMVMAE